MTPDSSSPSTPKPRGLACISPERRREIARMGGTAARDQGKIRLFTAETGSAAGKLGGYPKQKRNLKPAE